MEQLSKRRTSCFSRRSESSKPLSLGFDPPAEVSLVSNQISKLPEPNTPHVFRWVISLGIGQIIPRVVASIRFGDYRLGLGLLHQPTRQHDFQLPVISQVMVAHLNAV